MGTVTSKTLIGTICGLIMGLIPYIILTMVNGEAPKITPTLVMLVIPSLTGALFGFFHFYEQQALLQPQQDPISQSAHSAALAPKLQVTFPRS